METKQVVIIVPAELHAALKKVAATELRSLQQQCLHCFYDMCREFGHDIPITFEDGQQIRRMVKDSKRKIDKERDEMTKKLTGQ